VGLNLHHRRALGIMAAAVALDVALGLLFAAAQHVSAGLGLYFAVTTATTVGYGDVSPRGWAPHVIAVAMMLTVIPLFAATFSLVTTGLTSGDIKLHIDKRHGELKDRIGGG
jgi:voltage-gated potassium channel